MGLDSLINRKISKDTCVYWGAPVDDGYGTYTYADPVELNCFWIEEIKTIMTDEKKEVVSKAQVLLNTDVAQHGMLYHGSLDDLFNSVSEIDNPKNIGGAYEVIHFTKTPSLITSNQYTKIAYL